MKKNTTPIVDAIGELNFEGNYVPQHWCKNISMPSGKSDIIGVVLLSHFAYGKVDIYSEKIISTDYFQVDTKELANVFCFTERQVIDAVVRLCENHYLIKARLTKDEIEKFFSKKTPQKFPKVKYVQIHTCEWCKSETFILHEHHYPITKSDGGTEIIKLCPNCHFEYHYLNKLSFYRVNKEQVELIGGGL